MPSAAPVPDSHPHTGSRLASVRAEAAREQALLGRASAAVPGERQPGRSLCAPTTGPGAVEREASWSPRGAGPWRALYPRPISMATQPPSRASSEMSRGADAGSGGGEAAARAGARSPAEDGFAPSALGTREQ